MHKHYDLHQYVQGMWPNLTSTNKLDKRTLIGLPNSYVVPSVIPNNGFVYNEQYYWDTYFIVQGLIADRQNDLAVGMVENLLFMIDQYGMVPNASRLYMLSRSQPPVLHMAVKAVWEAGLVDDIWLKRAYRLLRIEYDKVWTSKLHPHNRSAFDGLSRYYDINMIHGLAEAESGWDATDRFDGRCLDYIPIDLNALLVVFEQNMTIFAEALGLHSDTWRSAATDRFNKIVKYMWSEKDGWFYDYNYKTGAQGSVASLAGATPLLIKELISDDLRAKLISTMRSTFETDYGLRTSVTNPGKPYQWAGSNGWAPLHMFAVEGLINYGQTEYAKQVATKWLNTVNADFQQSGVIYEKYNVVQPSQSAVEGLYPNQQGFAWTNASVSVFVQLVNQQDEQ